MAKRKNDKILRVDKSDLVKESNAIARAQLVPQVESIWEERIIAQVAACNRMSDNEFPEHAFTIGQLAGGRKHIDGRTWTAINNACARLAGTKFRIQFSRSHFRVYAVFTYIEYDNGIISAKFNQDLKPYFLQLKREFTLYSLPEFRSLSSIHSQQLYRFLMSLRGLEDTTVPIERLHFVTSAPNTLKKDFRNFRMRILEPTEKEINAKTSLKFNWEPIRQGRKVTEIRFIFSEEPIEATVQEITGSQKAQQTERDEHSKWQRLSNACFERHQKEGVTCKPNNGNKCTFCRTRGRMFIHQ